MARHPMEIRADLDSLGPNPVQQHAQEKAALEQELLDAAREATEREAAYWADRHAIEAELATYAAMCAQITRALPPVLEMMTEAVRLERELEDRRSRLIGEGVALKLGQGGPQWQRYDWVSLIAAELRRARREGW
jgi:hypothetical protein